MKRVDQLIIETAQRVPENIAVVTGKRHMTYSELVERSQQISAMLSISGLQPDDIVAVYTDKSIDSIALMVGVWLAQGIITSIDPTAPPVILEAIISDATPRIILTSHDFVSRVVEAVNHIAEDVPIIMLITPDAHPCLKLYDNSTPLPNNTAPQRDSEKLTDNCYISYTSGSEGPPKGIEGLHSSLAQYLLWQARAFDVTENDRFSQVAPLSFDFSLKEIFVPLICGASVCLIPHEVTRNPEELVRYIREQGITTWCCVPTMLRMVYENSREVVNDGASIFPKLRLIMISGDVLRWEDVHRWRAKFGRIIPLVTLYGPTESTVIKLFYRIPDDQFPETQSVPVGQPIDDAAVLIVDEMGQPCQEGEVGQITLLSNWIAKGYHNPNLTKADAFSTIWHHGKLVRLYRTGDLGRLLEDGNVEFMGRRDRQLKIHGHRLELDAVEAILAGHPEVEDVGVVITGSDDAITMFCYFTAKAQSFTEIELRRYSEEHMLPYMVPRHFMRLDIMPLSSNGKIDRKGLRELAQDIHVIKGPKMVTKETTLEECVLDMWCEILDVETIQTRDNFYDLGGTSMLEIRLFKRLREEICPQLTMNELFHCANFGELLTLLRAKQE